jgi:pimeloyl-ACP methyl ester carboxylesterase
MVAVHAPVVLLPGILMPAGARFAPLMAALGASREAWPKELEVYAGDAPPPGYALDDEVAGLLALLDERGVDRAHLYGHSAGGSIALAFTALHGDRVLSLALDEPATDFSAEDQESIAALRPRSFDELSAPQRMQVFARSLVRPDVELPPPPSGPPPPGMANRPAGLAAFEKAITGRQVSEASLAAFRGPVYFSYGSLSNPRWEVMAQRTADRFTEVEVERYEGLHHLNTSHTAEPERVALALATLWTRAARG